MKTIGLLGGTGWSSTIGYYKLLNEKAHQRCGGYHSAQLILYSVDYHEIMSNYGKDHTAVAAALKKELKKLIALNPDGIIICCNSLHKYYDLIKPELNVRVPVFHAIDLVADEINKKRYKKVLLLATKFTMEDGFFAQKLEDRGIAVVIPDQKERNEMQRIHGELMQNIVTVDVKNYFCSLIERYNDCDAVVLGCTEYPLVVDKNSSVLPIIDPVQLQTSEAVDFAMNLTT